MKINGDLSCATNSAVQMDRTFTVAKKQKQNNVKVQPKQAKASKTNPINKNKGLKIADRAPGGVHDIRRGGGDDCPVPEGSSLKNGKVVPGKRPVSSQRRKSRPTRSANEARADDSIGRVERYLAALQSGVGFTGVVESGAAQRDLPPFPQDRSIPIR